MSRWKSWSTSRTRCARAIDEEHLQEMSASLMDELLKWRDEFPILGRTTYMISNSLGAMPRSVYDKVREYAESWATRGVRAWEESWWDLAATVGDKVAALICPPPR